jgi:transcriptional regulator with XRE-family HTH domain
MPTIDESARVQLRALGDFIREQRHTAELSLRELAARTNVSNPYLSQIERGLHEPSVRVLKAIALALNLSAESLLTQAGMLEEQGPPTGTVTNDTAQAIATDKALTPEQRTALLAVYDSYVAANTTTKVPGAKKPRAKTRGSSAGGN